MPRIASDHRKSSDQRLVLFCDERATKRVIVRRPVNYLDARKCALRHFPSISSDHLVLQTDELDISLGERADITPEIWDIISETVSRFFAIERGTQITLVFQYKKDCEAEPVSIQCTVSPTITLRELFEGFEKHLRSLDPPVYDGAEPLVYHYNGHTISAPSTLSNTPQDRKMLDGALIECSIQTKPTGPVPATTPSAFSSAFASTGPGMNLFNTATNSPMSSLFGVPTPPISAFNGSKEGNTAPGPTLFRKPIIYIFAREEMDVSVSVSLIPQWSFIALYPIVKIQDIKSLGGTSRLHQRIQWEVETRSDGTLKEKTTGLDVAYLFWEASVNRDLDAPPSPISISEVEHELPRQQTAKFSTPAQCFDPLSCDVEPQNSVVLNVENITPYLDSTLSVLGLHTEARTSFITYWLPSFLKYTHVALRFIPQASYELAAPMDITPTPDEITRVFMLFKGVNTLDPTWDEAVNRSREDVRFWRGIVGVCSRRCTSDEPTAIEETPRLTVLEWGGMEIV